jgi:hypothetical protein
MASFRERFPPPWNVEETDRHIYVLDRRGVELLSIHVSPHDEPNRHLGRPFTQLNRRHARALARAICRLGNRER